MKVTLDGFYRNVKDETLLCNPQIGSSIILHDAEEFILPLLSGEDIFTHGSTLADKYQVPVEEVYNDLVKFYGKLTRQNLVKIDGGYHADMTFSNEEESSYLCASETSMLEVSPIDMFFNKHNRVAELHMDITSACTEKCIHCYVKQNDFEYMPYSLMQKSLYEFREQQGLTVQ